MVRSSLLALVLALPCEVIAQEADPRDQLIADAEAAADRDEHEQARALAVQAAALRETPSLRLFIAQQEALSGRTADAIRSARRCAADAGSAARNRQTILSTCRRLERELTRRVAMVTVRVPSAREDLHVRINGQEIPSDRWGEPMPVTPGEITVQASAGDASMRQILRIDAGDESTIELSFAGGELRSHELRDEEPIATSPPSPISPYWLAVPLGAAAVFSIVAIATGAAVLERGGAYDSLIDRCVQGDAAACDDVAPVRSEGEAMRDATNVFWAFAAVAGAAAVVLAFFVDYREIEALFARGESWAALRF